jgi:hypothetical protein
LRHASPRHDAICAFKALEPEITDRKRIVARGAASAGAARASFSGGEQYELIPEIQ